MEPKPREMLSIGFVLLVLAVVAVLLVACPQTTMDPSNEMTDGDTRAVRLLLDHYAKQRREIASHQMNGS